MLQLGSGEFVNPEKVEETDRVKITPDGKPVFDLARSHQMVSQCLT